MSFPPSEVTAVVGAGVSGLTCARTLRDAGRAVVVLERARGIGGRCATRTLDGQPVDYGPMFLHGRHPGFVAELDALIRAGGDGWPRRVEGRGSACQPEAFTPGERRWAPEAGVFALPRRLAQGLEVRTQTRVTGLARGPDGWMVQTEAEPLLAGRLVLAMAPEQTVGLLETAEAEMPALRGPLALLRTIQSEPCLTLLATYPRESPGPPWEALYPSDPGPIQMIARDSSKRLHPAVEAYVIQASVRWSRAHIEQADWATALLREAVGYLGTWAAEPRTTHPHRRKYARVDRVAALPSPLLVEAAEGLWLGIAGDAFAPEGGVEGAWLSGSRLAQQLLYREKV